MSILVTLESSLQKKKRYLRDSLYQLQNLRAKTSEGRARSFFDNTYPHAIEIFDLLNPLYLNGIEDFSKIALHDCILVRDGFYPLADFFYRFQRPGKVDTILLVHEKLKHIVPRPWANHVATYHIQRTFNCEQSRKSPRTLYICALSCSSDIRNHTFRQKIAQVRETYGENLANIDLKLGVLLRTEPYYWEKREELHPSFSMIREAYIQLGMESKFYTWREMAAGRDLRQSCYYYMTEDCFSHAYSYIDHFFLTRYCMPFDDRFDPRPNREKSMVVPFHFGYDIHINEFNFQSSGFWDEVTPMLCTLGIADSLFHSEFFPYSWEVAKKYLFKEENVSEHSSTEVAILPRGELTRNPPMHLQ